MSSSQPTVSIGVPTYNRPDGVLRTLKQLAAQNYQNLEIVVSNNCSTNEIVRPLLDECARRDPRIKVIHQSENIGLVNNFKYVLEKSTSDFFMWAADDDEWHPDFVKVCVETHLQHKVGTVMTGFYRDFRAHNHKGVANLPLMTGDDRFADVMGFFNTMPHSMFYGLHRRSTVLWFADAANTTGDDEYLLLRQMLLNGVRTVPDQVLYTAGVDDVKYKIKLPPEAADRYVFQCRRLMQFATLLLEANQITDAQRLAIMQRMVVNRLHFVLDFEADMREPGQYELTKILYHFFSQLRLPNINLYTKAMFEINQAQDAAAAAARAAAEAAAASTQAPT